MTPAKRQALELFQEVVENLRSPDRDLLRAILSCQHACTLLGWDGSKWFDKELGGYNPNDEEVPNHRNITGQIEWQTERVTMIDSVNDVVGLGPDPESESTSMFIWHGVDQLIRYASTGTRDATPSLP